MTLEGTVALVTGGAQGIGRATVARLHERGSSVAFVDRDVSAGVETAIELLDDETRFIPCDVADEEQVRAAVTLVAERHGRLDIVVNNAGVNAYHDAGELTAQEWEAFFAVDLRSAWLFVREALPLLRVSGRGAIVNVASIHAFMTVKGMFPYAAAKAGIVGMTRSMALDFGSDAIRVNAVCPGIINTRLVQEWLAHSESGVREQMLARQPLGRIGEPEDVANLIAFLASEEAGYLTGAAIVIDGGLSCSIPL